ncbi:MAG TPA: DNA repair protein RecN [Solirubrobacteraceae bacterium]|nr:DNA repair protein RecN [Solirubrobacteraceae bacterium]
MLSELSVENLLLIERARLRLAPGLNVLTGETGAGKTVLAHALDLLLGGRARASIVRPGAQEAYVEGIFELPRDLAGVLAEELDPELRLRLEEGGGEVVLSRRVGGDGRTRGYLNGRACAIGEMRTLGGALMSFYGQHEHRRLTIATSQRALLDGYCGHEHEERVRACARAHADALALRARVEALDASEHERARELDLLDYELAEIDTAEADLAAYDRLLGTRERLRRLGELRAATAAAAHALDSPDDAGPPGAGGALGSAAAGLEALAGVDERLDALAERLRAIAIDSADVATELRRYADDLDHPAGEGEGEAVGGAADRLDGLEERLERVERLARKHGGGVEAVLAHRERSLARRAELRGADATAGEDRARLQRALDARKRLANAIGTERRRFAPLLAEGVARQLDALAMPEASFDVELRACEPGPTGSDEVEFVLAPNPGVPPGPLRDIASGGELSRVMLAIMAVAAAPAAATPTPRPAPPARAAPRRTLVFDEVDAGIGGLAARAVGERLRDLSASRQVVCITHLPQVASLAERHFSIVKDSSLRPALASVHELARADVVSELVRMLGADADDSGARRHARELLRAA